MDLDDLEPRNKPQQRKNLDALGIVELKAYIAELEAEIERARAVIAAKEGHRSAADKLFGS